MANLTEQKYAILILPVRSNGDDREVSIASNVETFVASLSELVDSSQLEHWQRWVGDRRWKALSVKTRVVVTTSPSIRPDVLDAENELLLSRLSPFVAALSLAGGLHRPWGASSLLSGSAVGRRAFSDVRTLSDNQPTAQPLYEGTREYLQVFDGNEDRWLDEWIAAAALVEQTPLHPLISYALNSMSHAMVEHKLEFRIPELVRAAETVLALPKGATKADFPARSLRLAPHLTDHRFLAGLDVSQLLQDLFQLRSDCVHGKLPFEAQAEKGALSVLRVAQMEFAAEQVARAAVLTALRQPGAHFANRAALEDAWRSGSFPTKNTVGVALNL